MFPTCSSARLIGHEGPGKRSQRRILRQKRISLRWSVIALINEGSASASEIVAGRTQRQRSEAILVGTRASEGSVRRYFAFRDESGLFHHNRPLLHASRTEIDKVGLQPDITVEGEMVKEREKDLQLQGYFRVKERIASQEALATR